MQGTQTRVTGVYNTEQVTLKVFCDEKLNFLALSHDPLEINFFKEKKAYSKLPINILFNFYCSIIYKFTYGYKWFSHLFPSLTTRAFTKKSPCNYLSVDRSRTFKFLHNLLMKIIMVISKMSRSKHESKLTLFAFLMHVFIIVHNSLHIIPNKKNVCCCKLDIKQLLFTVNSHPVLHCCLLNMLFNLEMHHTKMCL